MKGSDSAWLAGEKTPTRPPNRSSRYSANFRRRKKSSKDRIIPVDVHGVVASRKRRHTPTTGGEKTEARKGGQAEGVSGTANRVRRGRGGTT